MDSNDKLSCTEKKIGALGRLAASIAHSVNNPLTYSMNYLFILKSGAPDEKTAVLLKKVEQGINEAKDALQRLIDLSNPFQGPIETFELDAAVKDALKMLRPDGVDISMEYGADTTVRALRSLNVVIFTLINNAIEAGAKKIIISASEEGDSVVLRVSDNGPGIKDEHLPKVFEPYFTTKQKAKGLGLYSAYHIVKSSDGDMWCRSVEGSGAEFGVRLGKGIA